MLAFAIKSAIYLSIMFIPYMLLMKNESFFRFNRALLLCILVLSLVLPICNFHGLAVNDNPVTRGFVEVGEPIAILQGAEQTAQVASPSIHWVTIVAYVYIAGLLLTLLYKIFQMTLLYRIIHKGVLWKEEKDGITIYCHANEILPFSWFNSIAISEKDYNETGEEILSHERGHVQCHHSMDIMLANIVEIIQWFNPLTRILASSLRDVHEFEADDAVLTSGVNMKQYQMLLIRKATGANSYAFANGFNHSLIKKRIKKMLQPKSNPWKCTKALYIIPVAVIALSAFATPELNNRVDVIADKAPSAIVGEGTSREMGMQTIEDNSYIDAQTIAEAIGKDEKDPDWLNNYIIVIDGKVVTKEEMKEFPKESISDMTVVTNSEIVKKYTSDPKVKAVWMVNQKKAEDAKATGTDETFDVVEKMPSFPGGNMEMMKFVCKTVRYPKAASDAQIAGRSIVKFTVEKDGSITDVHCILFKKSEAKADNANNDGERIEVIGYADKATSDDVEGARKALMAEAERVIKAMPKWEPGMQNGQTVRVNYVVPVTFRLM